MTKIFALVFTLLFTFPAFVSAQESAISVDEGPKCVVESTKACDAKMAEVIYIIDKSGSMGGLEKDVVGGYNAFVREQRSIKDKSILMTTVFFSNSATTRYDAVDIREVELKDADYLPSGGTALYDAMGNTLSTVSKRLSATPVKDRPCNVVVVIMTDGQENSSTEYTSQTIKRMVEDKQKNAGWEFLFFGANIDAYAAGDSIGVKREKSFEFKATGEGVRKMQENAASQSKSALSK